MRHIGLANGRSVMMTCVSSVENQIQNRNVLFSFPGDLQSTHERFSIAHHKFSDVENAERKRGQTPGMLLGKLRGKFEKIKRRCEPRFKLRPQRFVCGLQKVSTPRFAPVHRKHRRGIEGFRHRRKAHRRTH